MTSLAKPQKREKAAPTRIRRSPIARKAEPLKRKPGPRCKHCGHPESRHDASHLMHVCTRCKACPGYEPKRKVRSDKMPRGTRKSDVGKAGRTLWKKFSAWVKRRDGNQCFTCPAVVSGVELQAGHMFPGRTGALLYDPLVVFSQCDSCNRGKRGNTPEFVRRYIERFGVELFRAAVVRTSREKKWTTHELRELIGVLNQTPDQYEAFYKEKHGALLQAEASARGIE